MQSTTTTHDADTGRQTTMLRNDEGRAILSDAVAFANLLFTKMVSGVGAELPIEQHIQTSMEPFDRTQQEIHSLLADHPKATEIKRLLDHLSELCLTIAGNQRDLGIEYGIAAERFRQTLVAGLDGPRRCRERAG